ncbi:acyltransferase family protein [Pinibacter aurantiacus]|uniref:Acyltransferase n=1 Tax=Pinibacter aurantiacus TaxID=2851599 RepID=A0A9E2SD02_9BACT|nr:acyltransferase [Pinibacter aurantiacus]MBV4359832.1 acyltransferase [Pinibacter aurantiacus]
MGIKNNLFNADFVLSRNRQPWIDYVRGICIIMVCYRHCFDGLTNADIQTQGYIVFKYLNVFLFSFRMPLFFIVSGLFVAASLNKKGLGNYVSDRFKVIFYPLLVWGTIQITLQLQFAPYVNAHREVIDYLNLIIYPRKIEQFWYLNALFVVGVIYAFIKVKLKLTSLQHLAVALVFYGIGGYLHAIRTGAFIFTDVFHYYLFFAIGDNISQFVLNKDKAKYFTQLKYVLPVFVLFIITHYFFTKINLRHNQDYYIEHYMPLFFLVVALTGCCFIVQISFLLEKAGILKFLRIVGYHSLFIYVMHLIVLAATRALLVHVFDISSVPVLLTIGISMGITLPIIIYNILSKAGAWWLFSLKKPVEELNFTKETYKKKLLASNKVYETVTPGKSYTGTQ